MTPVKAVIVLPFGSQIQMEHYRQVFAEWSVWVTPDDESLWQVIADADPDVTISLGQLASDSGLWAMPLWRRRTWLHLPDATVAPDDVFNYALALVMSLLEDEAFHDSPLVSLVPLAADATQIATMVSQITAGQDYDNIEVVVQSSQWNAVRDQLQGHISLAMLRQIPNPIDDTPNACLRSAMGSTRGTIVWPVSTTNEAIAPDFLTAAVALLASKSDVHAIISGHDLQRESLLHSVGGSGEWNVDHVIFEQSFLLHNRKFIESFPVVSLGALLCLLSVEPSTHFIEPCGGSSITRELFTAEPDSSHAKLLRGAVGYARLQLTAHGYI